LVVPRKCAREIITHSAAAALPSPSAARPDSDASGKRNHDAHDFRASVTAGGNTAPVLQSPEHDLAPVAALVVFDGLATRLPAGEAELCAKAAASVVRGTCGKARSGVEVPLVDAHDCEVPLGTMNEFLVRTDRPCGMNSGYFIDPEVTAKA
jgi:hypothetical protein